MGDKLYLRESKSQIREEKCTEQVVLISDAQKGGENGISRVAREAYFASQDRAYITTRNYAGIVKSQCKTLRAISEAS